MTDATHFIEVWSGSMGTVNPSIVYPIDLLDTIVAIGLDSNGLYNTVAIFKIKKK